MSDRSLNGAEIAYCGAVGFVVAALILQIKLSFNDPLNQPQWGPIWEIALAVLFPAGIAVWSRYRSPAFGLVAACVVVSGIWCLTLAALFVRSEWINRAPRVPPRVELRE